MRSGEKCRYGRYCSSAGEAAVARYTPIEARARLQPQVRLETRNEDGPWRAALPAAARREGRAWTFELPPSGVEPLLRALIDGHAGIEALSIERPGLHDAFVAIAGADALRQLNENTMGIAA